MKRTRMMVTTLAMAMMALDGTTAAFAAEGEAAVACTPAVEATSVEVDEMKLTDDMEGTVAVAVVAAQEAQKVTGENDTVPMEKLEKDWIEHPILHMDLNIEKYDCQESLDNMLEKTLAAVGKACMEPIHPNVLFPSVSLESSNEPTNRQANAS